MVQRVAAITGAFGILGSAVSRAARQAGWAVAMIDMAPPPAAAGGDATLLLSGVDLTDAAGAQGAIDAVVARFGKLDVLFNIAGGFTWTTLADSSPADFEKMFRLNLMTCSNACRAATPALIASGSGRIVNVGALGAHGAAAAGMGAYTASKAGVHKLTESLAQELKGKVTVNAVLPSIIDTPQNRADMPKSDPSTWVQPDELAAVMMFFASEGASAVTGSLTAVAGRV